MGNPGAGDMSDTVNGDSRRSYRRRWWVALPLTLLGGVGYLYLGRPGRFALLVSWNVLFLVVALHGVWGRFSQPAFYLTFIALGVLASIVVLIDLVAIAVRQRSYHLRWYNRWWIYVILILLVGGLSVGIEAIVGRNEFAARNFVIPSGSLVPTLLIGDHIVTDTRAYEGNTPDYGELVIFKLPRDGKTDYVKRIVGLPGDRVQLRQGILYINDQAVPRERIDDYVGPGATCNRPGEVRIPRYMETLPNGVRHEVLDCQPGTDGDDTTTFTVPPDHFFTVGDNRDNSNDSRFGDRGGVGMVPRANIFARVTGIIFSWDFSRIGTRPR